MNNIHDFTKVTVVWEKFMVRNIREKKIRDKNFHLNRPQTKFFNAEYYELHAHTYMYVHPFILPFITCAALIRVRSQASYY